MTTGQRGTRWLPGDTAQVPVDLDLPEPEDDFERKLVGDVRQHGWHCVLVADEHHPHHAEENAALGPHPVYDAAFAYTVGLPLTMQHPELVLVGRWDQTHKILATVVELISEGRAFRAGETSSDVLYDVTVRFDPVSKQRQYELLTYATWANDGWQKQFEALQVVIPDPSGRWPDDPRYGSHPQPLLSA